MLSLLFFLVTLVAVVSAFAVSRRFVRERLRFVNAVQRPSAPLIAGAGTLAVGSLLALVLPFVGMFTAASLAVAVGLGVSTGARAGPAGAGGRRGRTEHEGAGTAAVPAPSSRQPARRPRLRATRGSGRGAAPGGAARARR